MIGSEPMKRVDVFIKVELELDEEEKPEKVAGEICRQIQKIYVVRRTEVSNVITKE
jgi:hypothetical protein